MKRIIILTICVSLLSIVVATVAPAQTVFLARKALGAVQHLTSAVVDAAGNKKAEAASVLLEAEADKVYATSLRVVKENPRLRILAADPVSRTIDFTDGDREMIMKVGRLQDNLSQILISSYSSAGKAPDTSPVVKGILQVCREMKKNCSVADN